MVNRTDLSGIAQKLRAAVLEGDGALACRVAEQISNQALNAFNEANTDVATSLLARSLLIKGMLDVAATWMQDQSDAPLPECFAAMRSLVDDPPPNLTGECYVDPSILKGDDR